MVVSWMQTPFRASGSIDLHILAEYMQRHLLAESQMSRLIPLSYLYREYEATAHNKLAKLSMDTGNKGEQLAWL